MVNLTRAKRISGWMNEKELEFLANIAKYAEVTIEIGSYYGRSCMAIADNTPGKVYAVDPYMGEYPTMNNNIRLDFDEETREVFMYNLSEHIETGKVVPFRGVFTDFSPDVKADFVFIDGDHSYEGCLSDIKHAMKLINPKGVIAGHDFGTEGFQGVDKSVKEMFGDEFKVVETIWAVQLD